jgi:hypothetical protein
MKKNYALAAMMLAASALTLSAEQTWTSLGTGKFNDPFVSVLYNVEVGPWPVEIQQCNENSALYRMVNPYGTSWEYNGTGVYTIRPDEDTYVVFDTSNPEAVTISNTDSKGLVPLNVQLSESYGELEIYPRSGVGTFSNGVILFPEKALAFYLSGNQSAYYAGEFKVTLPGASDYSVGISHSAICEADNSFTFSVTAGADVARLVGACYKGAFKVSAENNQTIANQGTEISAGDVTFTPDEPESGWWTYYVVSLDADGNVQEGAVAYAFCITHNPDEWTSLGYGLFTDDTFGPVFGVTAELPTVLVEVLENVATPGCYRIVNPYENNDIIKSYPQYFHADHNHYVDINATDTTAVKLPASAIGVQVGSNDAIVLQSYSAGTLSNHTITFPQNGLINYFGPNGGYYANQNSRFALTLPHFVATVSVGAADATVSIDDEAVAQAVTGADGVATLTANRALAAGSHTVSVSCEGYFPAETTIDVTDGVFVYTAELALQEDPNSSISELSTDAAAPVYYDLQGRRVTNPRPGRILVTPKGALIIEN